jgi:hypothetical protein
MLFALPIPPVSSWQCQTRPSWNFVAAHFFRMGAGSTWPSTGSRRIVSMNCPRDRSRDEAGEKAPCLERLSCQYEAATPMAPRRARHAARARTAVFRAVRVGLGVAFGPVATALYRTEGSVLLSRARNMQSYVSTTAAAPAATIAGARRSEAATMAVVLVVLVEERGVFDRPLSQGDPTVPKP